MQSNILKKSHFSFDHFASEFARWWWTIW